MSSKAKSITELVTELQEENESLQSLKKLFNQAVKNEFGYDIKELHNVVTKWEQHEKKVAERKNMQSYGQSQQQGQTEQHF